MNFVHQIYNAIIKLFIKEIQIKPQNYSLNIIDKTQKKWKVSWFLKYPSVNEGCTTKKTNFSESEHFRIQSIFSLPQLIWFDWKQQSMVSKFLWIRNRITSWGKPQLFVILKKRFFKVGKAFSALESRLVKTRQIFFLYLWIQCNIRIKFRILIYIWFTAWNTYPGHLKSLKFWNVVEKF